MVKIETGKKLVLKNVLSTRKILKQRDVAIEVMKFDEIVENAGVKKSGPIISTTHNVIHSDGDVLLDIEILMPLDNWIDVPEDYEMNNEFSLLNAVYARHIGKSNELTNTYDYVLSHIKKNNLTPVTNGYNVNVSYISDTLNSDEIIMDIYIGIDGNL